MTLPPPSPRRWRPYVILRLIYDYNFFDGVAELPKERIKIIETLANQALAFNAEHLNAPPMSYKIMEERLKNILESMNYSSIKPSNLRKRVPVEQFHRSGDLSVVNNLHTRLTRTTARGPWRRRPRTEREP